MSVTPRILVFGGSLRRGSFNQKLAALAAGKVRDAGGDATLIALRDYPLPLFDADLEEAEGMPAPARALKQLFLDHHGLIISSPEYNSSITGALKNAIDWVSRAESDDEPPLAAFEGKTASLLSASPGALGGLRGLVHLRAILGNLGVTVLPKQLAVSRAAQAFAGDGSLTDPGRDATLAAICGATVRHAARMLA